MRPLRALFFFVGALSLVACGGTVAQADAGPVDAGALPPIDCITLERDLCTRASTCAPDRLPRLLANSTTAPVTYSSVDDCTTTRADPCSAEPNLFDAAACEANLPKAECVGGALRIPAGCEPTRD